MAPRLRSAPTVKEDALSKRNYGILAGIIGSAFGAWWYRRRRGSSAAAMDRRGTVIYDNTPIAPDGII